MGPVDIIRAAEALEEQARILRLIAGDVEGNLYYWRIKWEREASKDQQT